MKSQQPPPLLLLPLPPHAAATTAAHGRALENLKSLVLKCAIASSPSKSLSLERTTLIENLIQESVPTVHTPDHPTYQWMIENAIKKLKEEGGCCDEGEICRFILKEQKDLPWAHDTFLNHHLNRLSINGTITKRHDGSYSFAPPKPSPSPGQRITRTTSLSPASSSSPTHASSDTSDSSWSSELKRRGTKKCNRGKRSQLQKQNVRASVTRPKLKRGGERACARGRGRGRRCDNPCKEDMREEACIGQVEGDLRVDAMPMVEIICLSTDDEETDQTEQVPHAQASQDCVNLASPEDQIVRVEGDACVDDMPTVEILCLLTDGEESDQRKQVSQARANQDCVNLASREHQIVRVERDVCVDGVPTVEILCLLTDNEETDQRKQVNQAQANQDCVNLVSREHQLMVMDSERLDDEYRMKEQRIQPLQQNMGGDFSTRGTIPSSRGSKNIRQQRGNIQSGQTRRGRGRPRKIETQDVNRVAQEDEDSMDALIDEVHNQLTKPTEIDGADVDLQRQELPQVDMNQEDNGEPIDRTKTRPRRTRNKSINVADGSQSSNARPARRRKRLSALV